VYYSNEFLNRLREWIEKHVARAMPLAQAPRRTDPPAKRLELIFPRLFLAPASSEALCATVERAVPFATAAQHLAKPQVAALKKALGGGREFRCAAIGGEDEDIFDRMRTDDCVLLRENVSGEFRWFGVVVVKLKSETLAKALWGVEPHKLIVVLRDVWPVYARREQLMSELGFNPAARLQGVWRVPFWKLGYALERHGSLERIFQACS
jgi:hypothetical protein